MEEKSFVTWQILWPSLREPGGLAPILVYEKYLPRKIMQQQENRQ